jgi:hypothetical protein
MPLLPETARAVDTLVSRAQAEGRGPSLALGVVRAGELTHVSSPARPPAPTRTSSTGSARSARP